MCATFSLHIVENQTSLCIYTFGVGSRQYSDLFMVWTFFWHSGHLVEKEGHGCFDFKVLDGVPPVCILFLLLSLIGYVMRLWPFLNIFFFHTSHGWRLVWLLQMLLQRKQNNASTLIIWTLFRFLLKRKESGLSPDTTVDLKHKKMLLIGAILSS